MGFSEEFNLLYFFNQIIYIVLWELIQELQDNESDIVSQF